MRPLRKAPAMTEVELIAAGLSGELSKAQRDALRRANDVGQGRLRANGHWRATDILFDFGLTDENEILTPLGRAVRKHIGGDR